MNPAPLLAAAVLVIGAVVIPAEARPPGHWSETTGRLTVSHFDFKDGFGIADPLDQNNPCTTMETSHRAISHSQAWEADQNMATNLVSVGLAVSNLVPPLPATGGWLPNSGGIPLNLPCPRPGSPGTSLWLVWSGMNWRGLQGESLAHLHLCSQKAFPVFGLGCLPNPGANTRLWVGACGDQVGRDPAGNSVGTANKPDWAVSTFFADYTDDKGKYAAGQPFEVLSIKNDSISCPVRHSHDYTNTILSFADREVGQLADLIENEAAVHLSHGTTYMVVCWRINYLDFSNPLAPVSGQANAHDWKLILDMTDPDTLADLATLLSFHYQGARVGDSSLGGLTVLMRGFYSRSPTGAGENGFGPCTAGPLPEANKPIPVV